MTDARTLRTLVAHLDACHAFVYFRPEAGLNLSALGLTGMDAYFASRAAPLGAVGPEAVVATFFNFNPELVHAAVPAVWETAAPAQVLDTRSASADQALRAMLGDAVDGPEMAEAAGLLRRVAEAGDPVGRPLFAANTGLEWPVPAHLQLFHAITLIREHRGDAHIAALLSAGLGALETLTLDVAAGRAKLVAGMLQATRGWSDEQWAEGFDALRRRGLVDADRNATEEGSALRERIEEHTDEMSTGIWSVLSDDEVDRVRALTTPFTRSVGAQLFG